MNEDPALEGMATVGFERNPGPGSERSWGGVSNSTTTYEHGDRERERNSRRRKNRQRDSFYSSSNRIKMGVAVGKRREEDFFTNGSRTAGEEDFGDRDRDRDGFGSPRSQRDFSDPFRGF